MSNFNNNNLDNLGSMFEQYEAPFEAGEMNADWQQVSNNIGATTVPQADAGASNGSSSGFFGSVGAKIGLGLFSLAAIFGVYELSQNDNETNKPPISNEIAVSAVSDDELNEETIVASDNETIASNFEVNKTKTDNTTTELNKDGFEKPEKTNTDLIASAETNEPTNKDANTFESDKAGGEVAPTEPSLVVSATSVCQNEGIRLRVNNAKAGKLYWFNMKCITNGATETGAFENEKVVKAAVAGTYILNVYEMSSGKQKSVYQGKVQVYKKPKAQFKSELTDCGKLKLMATSNAATENYWIAENKSLSGNDVDVTFANEGYKKIMLIAENEHCADTIYKDVYATQSVEALDNLVIPNIITPNGDGDNDEWDLSIKNPEVQNLNGEIEIRNYQTNKAVFKSTSGLSDKWNGKFMNVGRDCESGYYTYIIKFTNPCGNNEQQVKTGRILIRR